jgi:hypothetical protein
MEPEIIEAEFVSQESTKIEDQELTKKENQLIERKSKVTWLSESENHALEYFKNNRAGDLKLGSNSFSIAPSVQAQLFALYLNGKSCTEIRKLNPNFSLGQVVDAAVQGDWETQKQEYLNGLMKKARDRLQQTGCEAISFLADQLAAAHKMHGDSVAKYLQTGDPADLGSFGIGSMKQYRDALELLLTASGANKTSTLNVQGEVFHTSNVNNTPPASSVSTGNPGLSLRELAAQKKNKEVK